jgi:DNA-binding CsgD family transcriptional regulator
MYGGAIRPAEKALDVLSGCQLGEIALVALGQTDMQMAGIYSVPGERRVRPETIRDHLDGARRQLDVRLRAALFPCALARGVMAIETPAPYPDRCKLESELRRRDVEVIRNVARGMSYVDIESMLGANPGTIRVSMSRLCKRVDVPNTPSLVAAMVMTKLILPDQLTFVPFAATGSPES